MSNGWLLVLVYFWKSNIFLCERVFPILYRKVRRVKVIIDLRLAAGLHLKWLGVQIRQCHRENPFA